MGIGFGGTPGGMRIDMTDLADDGLSVKSVIHMPEKIYLLFIL
jgi:hypothetical protein